MINEDFEVSLEEIVAKSGALIVAMNADGEVFYYSPGFIKMTGLDISEIIGKSFVELMSIHHQKKVVEELEFTGTGIRELTTIVDCKNAVSRVVRWDISWVFDKDDKPMYRVANGYDMTVDVLANIAVSSSPRHLTMKYMEEVFQDDYMQYGKESRQLAQVFSFLQKGGAKEVD